MSYDPALQYLLDDAKAQGLSLRQYQRLYGVMLMPAEMDIAEAERTVSPEVMETERLAHHCPACARRAHAHVRCSE